MEPYSEWIYASISLLITCIVYIVVKKTINERIKKGQQLLTTVLNWLVFFVFLSILSSLLGEAQWLNMKLFNIGTADISLFLILLVIFILYIANKLSRLLKDLILPGIYEQYKLDPSVRFTFNSIFHYLIMVIAVFTSLNMIGINLNSLTVFASIFGVGIGFGMQNIAANFISGIIILFERPIKVGDRVIIDDIIGDVMEIKMRATVIRTRDNEHMIIPNSFFLEEKVINRSFGDPKIRLLLPVGVSYSSDVRLVESLLIEAAHELIQKKGSLLQEPPPSVIFSDFGDSSLDFTLIVWIDNPLGEFRAKSDLRFSILEKFRQNDIEIPFPQRDVHMRT